MTTEHTEPDHAPEPYLLRGKQLYRPVPQWHWRIQRSAMALAKCLDEWHTRLPEPTYGVFSGAGFLLRELPPTAIRLPLSVVRGQFPTLESDWVPTLPLLVVDVFVGADTYGNLEDRVDEYLACGVPLVWVLTPRSKTVTVHRPNAAVLAFDVRGTLDGFDELPGFSCRVADLFR